jgi:hypothetical protein
MLEFAPLFSPFVPAKAGTQSFSPKNWIPACAGMNGVFCNTSQTFSSGA